MSHSLTTSPEPASRRRPRHYLTDAEYLTVRELGTQLPRLTTSQIAEKAGVHANQVTLILNGKMQLPSERKAARRAETEARQAERKRLQAEAKAEVTAVTVAPTTDPLLTGIHRAKQLASPTQAAEIDTALSMLRDAMAAVHV